MHAFDILSAAWNVQGRLAEAEGRLDTAEAAYRAAAKAIAAAVALAPQEINYRRNVSVQTEALARTRLLRGDAAAALRLYEQSRDESAAVVALAPNNVEALVELAISEVALGDVLANSAYAPAKAAYQRGLAHFDHAVAMAPSVQGYAMQRGIAQRYLATLTATREPAFAKPLLAASVTVLRQVHARQPGGEATIELLQALLLHARLEPNATRASLSEALHVASTLRSLVGQDPALAAIVEELDRWARRKGLRPLPATTT